MNDKEKLELIKNNVVEIISEEELKEIIKKKNPVVYCGYELNGPMHLGHFVTITKLIDFAKAGFKVKVLLADVHTSLNRKGAEKEIKKEAENWKKTVKAIGLDAEIVLGSSFQLKPEYITEVMKLSQEVTINRGLRSMQEVARDIENATVSQVLYPLMQATDIKYLNADVAQGGLEQRKIHMLAKDMEKSLNHKFVAVHTPLLTSLKGPGQKMSKSIQGSGISVIDSYENIKKSIKEAYCPEKIAEENSILQISRLIIFPRIKSFDIKRPDKFGGNIKIKDYEELEKLYVAGKIHPLDLKNAVTEYLEQIISPIRKNWK